MKYMPLIFIAALSHLDLSFDCILVGAFLALAVVNEVLPPAFLSNRECKENSCLEHAVLLLSIEYYTTRLEKV